MKLALAGLIVITSLAVMPDARADLAPRDSNDVPFRLDVRSASSISDSESVGIGVFFYDQIPRADRRRRSGSSTTPLGRRILTSCSGSATTSDLGITYPWDATS